MPKRAIRAEKTTFAQKSVKKGLTDSVDSGIIIPFSKKRYSSVAQWQSIRLLTEGLLVRAQLGE